MLQMYCPLLEQARQALQACLLWSLCYQIGTFAKQQVLTCRQSIRAQPDECSRSECVRSRRPHQAPRMISMRCR